MRYLLEPLKINTVTLIFLCLSLSHSHLQKTKGRWEGWPNVLLHDPQRNGVWHQKWSFLRARRVWRESLWHKDQLHTRGHRNRKDLHSGCQPAGKGSMRIFFSTSSPPSILFSSLKVWKYIPIMHNLLLLKYLQAKHIVKIYLKDLLMIITTLETLC